MNKLDLLKIIEQNVIVNVDQLTEGMNIEQLGEFDMFASELLDAGLINQINIHPANKKTAILLVSGDTKIFILNKEMSNLLEYDGDKQVAQS